MVAEQMCGCFGSSGVCASHIVGDVPACLEISHCLSHASRVGIGGLDLRFNPRVDPSAHKGRLSFGMLTKGHGIV